MSDRMRARGLRAAGIAIILLSAGAILLPAGKRISSDMIGGLLISAGLIEAVAGTLRRDVRPFAMTAGAVTTVAGLIFVLHFGSFHLLTLTFLHLHLHPSYYDPLNDTREPNRDVPIVAHHSFHPQMLTSQYSQSVA